MNDFIQLLINYWKPIVGLLFTVFGFIIALIKKKPISSILDDIYAFSILAVKEVENNGVIGSIVKLQTALDKVLELLKDKYPTLEVSKYKGVIWSVIEDILSTPQKKGR